MPDDDATARKAVLADPLLGEVRRRHPDVDILLLPPDEQGTAPEPTTPFGANELAAQLERDDRELERTLEDLALTVEQQPRWFAGTDPGTLVRRSVQTASDLPDARAEDLVAAATAAFENRGWRVETQTEGHTRCRAAAPGGGTLRAEVLHVPATGRVAVSVVAGPYPVTDDLAEELREQQRGAAS